MNVTQYICLMIVLLPLLGALPLGICLEKLGRKQAHRLTVLAVGMSCLLSFYLLIQYLCYGLKPQDINFYEWGRIGNIKFQVGCLADTLSIFMAFIVTFISLIVHIYSIGYMKEDEGYARFFCYISAFTFSMLILVMANNFLQLFFGWEAVGLMSYLLIGFWFKKDSATKASLKAFLLNRIGDVGFLFGILAVYFYFNTLQYRDVFAAIDNFAKLEIQCEVGFGISLSAVTLMTLGLLIGALAKSAQIPLHFWLPDSMEGPTPISALIHAATMVTAGIFMIARLSPLFEYSGATLNLMLIIGCSTALLMGLVAIVQEDIKRIIAYSTISQLGYMMCGLGASAYTLSIFHLMTHAFFKALLFLGAGSVILAMHHEQNIWKMGGLKKSMPWTHKMMWIGGLALIGFPGFSGFYSKDLLIEAVGMSSLSSAPFVYYALLGGVFISALYIFRLIFVVFHGSHSHSHIPIKESPLVVLIPLTALAIPTIIFGMVFVGPFLHGVFDDGIIVHTTHAAWKHLSTHFDNIRLATGRGFLHLPFFLSMLGIGTAWLCYVKIPVLPRRLSQNLWFIYRILINTFGFDFLYRNILASQTKRFSTFCWQIADNALIDDGLVSGVVRTVSKTAGFARRLQTGYLYDYGFMMMFGFLILLVWLVIN